MEPAPTHGKISWLDISQVHVVPRHLGCHSFGQSFSLCSTYSSRSLLWDGNLPVWPQKITHMVLNTPAVASSWTKGDGHTTWISRNLDCRKNGLEKFFSFFSYWYFLCIFTGIWEKKNASSCPHQLSGILQISKISIWGWGLSLLC